MAACLDFRARIRAPPKHEWDRSTYLACFRLILQRCDPNLRGRLDHPVPFGSTILHSVAGSREHITREERVAFATMLLDAGAHTDIRDHLLTSTPLGWACRWGRVELVELLMTRGADPVEMDAQPWATPLAWAAKKDTPTSWPCCDGRVLAKRQSQEHARQQKSRMD